MLANFYIDPDNYNFPFNVPCIILHQSGNSKFDLVEKVKLALIHNCNMPITAL